MWQVLSSSDAIPQGTYAACTQHERTGWRRLPVRRACTARFRVARVSRLLGKSDTTANHRGWQVEFCSDFAGADHFGLKLAKAQTRKRHSIWSGVSVSYVATGLPSRTWTVVISTVPTADFPTGFPFFLKGRFVGGGSCRGLLFFGLADVNPAADSSLAPI